MFLYCDRNKNFGLYTLASGPVVLIFKVDHQIVNPKPPYIIFIAFFIAWRNLNQHPCYNQPLLIISQPYPQGNQYEEAETHCIEKGWHSIPYLLAIHLFLCDVTHNLSVRRMKKQKKLCMIEKLKRFRNLLKNLKQIKMISWNKLKNSKRNFCKCKNYCLLFFNKFILSILLHDVLIDRLHREFEFTNEDERVFLAKVLNLIKQ